MKILILTLLSLLVSKTVYGSNLIQFNNSQGSNSYSQSMIWSGNFIAPNGKKFQLGDFYKSKNIELNLKTNLVYKLNSSLIVIPIKFDNGYKSDLLNVSPIYSMGLIISKKIKNFNILVGVDNLIKLGGKINEQPCFDEFKREFHCGTGKPWTDYQGKSIYNYYQDKLIFRMVYNF